MTTSKIPTPLRLTLVALHPERSPQSVPLAAAFLAAAVREKFASDVTITILDLYLDQTAPECVTLINATRPDLVGFSLYAWNRKLACRVAGLLKGAKPQLTLLCGGPEATADSSGLLTEAPWDIIVRGEGEGAVIAVLDRLLAHAPLPEAVIITMPESAAASLDQLPSPLLSGTLDPAKYDGMLWQISRGCSFGCEFCYDGGGSRKVRRFSLERVEAELRWLVRHDVSQVFVLDSTFNSDRTRAIAILKLIRKLAPRIHFHFEVRSEFLDRQQAGLFAAITCSLQIGLQSGNSKVLQSVGRSFNSTDFSAKIGLLNESGAIFGFDLIYGLPGDTLAGFQESLNFALKLYPNHLDIFPLALLPGTQLAARAATLGMQQLPEPPYTVTATAEFPATDLARAANIAQACDIFYSRGKAVSWFLTLATAVKITPAELLGAFADYLAGANVGQELSEEQICKLQRDFITRLLTQRGAKKLLPLALDLVTYNYHYAAALMTAAPQLPTAKELSRLAPLQLKLSLAPSARLADFNYEILEILELESGDLRAMAAALTKCGSSAVIYPKQGEVLTESLHASYLRLLQRLDGHRSVKEICAQCGLDVADAADFLRFALGEGIVVVALNSGEKS